jgi:hypothetical protein
LRLIAIAFISVLLLGALALEPRTAQAQGGPPLVTDDPDTPGNGHWENNLATIASRSGGRWSLEAPDADLNYGWGPNIQLNADIPLAAAQVAGGGWDVGLGTVALAVKWRFLEDPDQGYAVSTYPRYSSAWVASSWQRGLAAAGHAIFLPLEAATKLSAFGLDAEIGRNFVSGGPGDWQLGGVVAHDCSTALQCLFEVHETLSGHSAQTLLNLGAHWQLRPSLALIGAAGREFGRAGPDQQVVLLYLGIQIVR